ncbi:MAG: Hsp20/alpha crystallin family protein [Rhodococcus sp. (in: high G+C Gram-positive bacteria)]
MLRFDPFRDLDAVTSSLLGTQSGTDRSPRFMPMDLYKVDDHYVLDADLPGVDPGSIDLDVDRGTLTLTAHRSSPSDDSRQWLTSERFTGTYRRQLALGDGVDTERITASYDNGVLSVHIPLLERAAPRKIDIAQAQSADRHTIEAG